MTYDEYNAMKLMLIAHKGQVDEFGEPYIDHPKRVGSAGLITVTRIVRYLHDTVEKTDLTLDKLREHGVSEEIIDVVDAITHRADESDNMSIF